MLLLGTHDFFGLNHYTTALAENYDRGTEWPGWDFDRDIQEHVEDNNRQIIFSLGYYCSAVLKSKTSGFWTMDCQL